MALTPSNTMAAGTVAPDFSLLNTVNGSTMNLSECKGAKGTVIFFICNHCPFVLHVNEGLIQLAKDYQDKGFGFVAISSNDVETHPQDGPDAMKVQAEKLGYPFPYLFDGTQTVAKAYDAACTPDLYVFDSDLKSVYHGQLDASRPGNDIPVTGDNIRAVLDALLETGSYNGPNPPSIGCNIKWK